MTVGLWFLLSVASLTVAAILFMGPRE